MAIEQLEKEKLTDYIARDIQENIKTLPISEAIKKSFDEIETDKQDVYKIVTETIGDTTIVKVKVDEDLTWSRMLKSKNHE